ncbi:MAG: hypothetical protein KJN97_13460 [Deltaproteobacteria bacterium]|nr:hypothetical protein [Deltaproteobacteria bacterium]
MGQGGWDQLSTCLRAAGWVPEQAGSQVLQSPHNSLALTPDLDDPEHRRATLVSIEQRIETISGYQAEGHEVTGSDLALAEFAAALHLIRHIYGGTTATPEKANATTFEDRIHAERYENDEPFAFRIEPGGQAGAERFAFDVSERLVDRLRCIAIGYDLPLLSRLPVCGDENWEYPAIQAVSLQRELAFIVAHVSDPLLERTLLRPLAALVGTVDRNATNGGCITVEPP